MPFAVTHILIPIIVVTIIRDFILSKKQKSYFNLHYVLIAGLGGVLPDIDILFSFILKLIGATNWNLHQTFTHSFLLSLTLVVIALALIPINKKARICNIGRHNLTLSLIFFMLALGSAIHVILDALFGELAFLLYPLSTSVYGINLLSFIPKELQFFTLPAFDGILLVIWLVYMDIKHKITNYI